jgi:hypothetical protein
MHLAPVPEQDLCPCPLCQARVALAKDGVLPVDLIAQLESLGIVITEYA